MKKLFGYICLIIAAPVLFIGAWVIGRGIGALMCLLLASAGILPLARFKVGQCLVEGPLESWNKGQYEILEVGKESYRIKYYPNLPFSEQHKYSVAPCDPNYDNEH